MAQQARRQAHMIIPAAPQERIGLLVARMVREREPHRHAREHLAVLDILGCQAGQCSKQSSLVSRCLPYIIINALYAANFSRRP